MTLGKDCISEQQRGHRKHNISKLPKKEERKSSGERKSICYARVSSNGQEDLERQVELFRRKYPDYKIIKDIESNLNFKRRVFRDSLYEKN